MVEIIDVDVISTLCSCRPTSLFVNKLSVLSSYLLSSLSVTLNEILVAREITSAGILKVLCSLIVRSFTNELTLHGNVEMFQNSKYKHIAI